MAINRLLARLRRKDHRHLIAACDVVHLLDGHILWEPRSRIRRVYFPLDCFISQLVPVYPHANLELTLVGSEGMVGTPLVLGVQTGTMQALVQGSGTALHMSAASFQRELEHTPALRQALNRYIHVLQAQLALTAACISFHSLNLRLAGLLCLLSSLERRL